MKKVMFLLSTLLLVSVAAPLFAFDVTLAGGLYLHPDTKELLMVRCNPEDGLVSEVLHSQGGRKFVRYEIMSQEEIVDNSTATIHKVLKLYHEKAPNVVYYMRIITRGYGDYKMIFETARRNDSRVLLRLSGEENIYFSPDDSPAQSFASAMQHQYMQFYDIKNNIYTDAVGVSFSALEDPAMFEIILASQGETSHLYCGFDKDLNILIGTDNVPFNKGEIVGKLSILSKERWCLSLYDKQGNFISSFANLE
ncbi:hypothetical protein [Thermoflexibacter ruber]|nr:hypothetical protein [Thermoflexibacter ruber]